jgi:hypothetical protein
MHLKRTCPGCNKTKDLTEEYFNKIESIPNAFDYYCKPCMEKIKEFIEKRENG